jgi:hypothetical protein
MGQGLRFRVRVLYSWSKLKINPYQNRKGKVIKSSQQPKRGVSGKNKPAK